MGPSWTNETFTFTTMHAPAAWWDNTWQHRKEIIIDHTLITAVLLIFHF